MELTGRSVREMAGLSKQWAILAIANAGRWAAGRWRGCRVWIDDDVGRKKEPKDEFSLPAAPASEAGLLQATRHARVRSAFDRQNPLGAGLQVRGAQREAAADDCNDDRL